jgi:serine/threonine protein kinase
MDPTAKDLVEKMLQTDPNVRINIKDMKKHPYFSDVDFELVSLPEYQGARILVEQTFEEIKQERAEKKDLLGDLSQSIQQDMLSVGNFNLGGMDHMSGVSYLPMIDPTTILLKGYLLKENWYGNK